MKKCTSCKKMLPFSEFFKNSITKDGYGSQCKTCDKAGRVIRRRAIKQRLVDVLGGCCSRCGYTKCLGALDFHHHSGNKEYGISEKLKFGSFDSLLPEVMKCILLCRNCHSEEHELDISKLIYGANSRNQIRHGTTAGYARCKPPCDPCRKAWNAYCLPKQRARRARKKLISGS
jgi:hypothetical protein